MQNYIVIYNFTDENESTFFALCWRSRFIANKKRRDYVSCAFFLPDVLQDELYGKFKT